LLLVQLDLDVHASGEVELHQRVNGFIGWVHDVEKTLVRPDLVLISRVLVDMRRHQHGEFLRLRRERDWSADLGARSLGGFDDFTRRLIDQAMIESFETDPDDLLIHITTYILPAPGRWVNA